MAIIIITILILPVIVISCVCLHKESIEIEQSSNLCNIPPNVLTELEYIPEKDYPLYTYLDFCVKQISHPTEGNRFYPVVKITGYKLGNNIANVVIAFDGRKDSQRSDPYWYSFDLYECGKFPTYDKVYVMLNDYYKTKNRNFLGADEPYPLNCISYYRKKDDAVYALCQFKKRLDEYNAKKEVSTQDVSETEIKIIFTN